MFSAATSKKFITLFLLTALTTSCAELQPSVLTQRQFTALNALAAPVALPPLNTEAVAQVGDTMIQGGNVYTRPAIRLIQAVIHRGLSKGPFTIQIPAGVLVASGTSRSGPLRGVFFEAQQPLQFVSAGNVVVKGGIFVPEGQGAPPEIYWHATDTGVPLVDPDPTIRFERTTHEEWQSESFRRELIYNGRSGGTIKLLYREFSEEQIRPAFTQEVTYDFVQGEPIGFKGARFQVIDADNIRIKYIVLHHFN